MTENFIEFAEKIIYAGAFVALAINLMKLGKAIGRIEQLLEVHGEAIEYLREIKVDKETCEAYRSDD